MKGKKFLCIIMGSLLLAGLVLAGSAMAADKYVVGIDGDYPPYSFIGDDGKATGFDVESIQWIAQKMGFEVEIKPVAWDGIIPALLAKKIDLIYSGMTASDERKKVVAFSNVYWRVNQAVCVRQDSDLNMISALIGKKKIGTQRGTTAAMWLEDNLVKKGYLAKDDLKLYDNFPLSIKDMENGRVESVMFDDIMVEKAIKDKPMKIIGTVSTGEDYAVAMRKEDTKLQKTVNDGLAMLMKSAKWQELKEKYDM